MLLWFYNPLSAACTSSRQNFAFCYLTCDINLYLRTFCCVQGEGEPRGTGAELSAEALNRHTCTSTQLLHTLVLLKECCESKFLSQAGRESSQLRLISFSTSGVCRRLYRMKHRGASCQGLCSHLSLCTPLLSCVLVHFTCSLFGRKRIHFKAYPGI